MVFSTEKFRKELLKTIPLLKSYARTLTPSPDAADDLLQETLLLAWEKRCGLRDIKQIKSWLYAIMRNRFYSVVRRAKNEVEDPDDERALELAVSAPQDSVLELNDVTKALGQLPHEQQQSLMLICIERLSYDEAAGICGCAIGTLKSRVSRARSALLKQVQWDPSTPAA